MYFRQDEDGLFVGYHFEDGENYEEAGAVRLSMATLDNNRPLYMANALGAEWSNLKYASPTWRLYRIRFKPVKFYPPITEHDEYMNLTHLRTTAAGRHHYVKPNSTLGKWVAEGYRCFAMIENDKGELPEGFLVHPKEAVVAIEDITVEVKLGMPFESINS